MHSPQLLQRYNEPLKDSKTLVFTFLDMKVKYTLFLFCPRENRKRTPLFQTRRDSDFNLLLVVSISEFQV